MSTWSCLAVVQLVAPHGWGNPAGRVWIHARQPCTYTPPGGSRAWWCALVGPCRACRLREPCLSAVPPFDRGVCPALLCHAGYCYLGGGAATGGCTTACASGTHKQGRSGRRWAGVDDNPGGGAEQGCKGRAASYNQGGADGAQHAAGCGERGGGGVLAAHAALAGQRGRGECAVPYDSCSWGTRASLVFAARMFVCCLGYEKPEASRGCVNFDV